GSESAWRHETVLRCERGTVNAARTWSRLPARSVDHCGDVHLKAHRWQAQCFDAQLCPDRRVTKHALMIEVHDRVVDNRQESSHMAGVDLNDVTPACASIGQDDVDVADGCR